MPAPRAPGVPAVAAVLPGRAFPVTMPVLAGVVTVLERRGYDVRPAAWTLHDPPADPAVFVAGHLAGIAPAGYDLVVGKSLGCWAAAAAGAVRRPGVWLTPVLTSADLVAAIRANPAPQLLVGGLADPMWDEAVARGLGCEVLSLAGVDHALSDSGDGVVSEDIMSRVCGAVDDFVGRLT